MKFARVRGARLDAKMAMADIAQVTDKSMTWVYNLERGIVTPTREDAEAMAALLGVGADDLFEKIREDE